MDLYEQLAEEYLTIFEHLAVIPQFPVLFDEKGQPCFHEASGKRSWTAFPDFLAVDIKNRQAQVVEVNKSVYPDQVSDLATRTLANRTKIEEYVMWFMADGYQIRWRFFVRLEMAEKLEARLLKGGLQGSITPLEDVFNKLRDRMP
jgi:hypothetical protein